LKASFMHDQETAKQRQDKIAFRSAWTGPSEVFHGIAYHAPGTRGSA
jgi:hypothetical protein